MLTLGLCVSGGGGKVKAQMYALLVLCYTEITLTLVF